MGIAVPDNNITNLCHIATTLPIYSALLRPKIRLSALCHVTTVPQYLTHSQGATDRRTCGRTTGCLQAALLADCSRGATQLCLRPTLGNELSMRW